MASRNKQSQVRTFRYKLTEQDIEKLYRLFDLWERAVKEYEIIPDKHLGLMSQDVSRLALGTLSRSDSDLESLTFRDAKLADIHYNFCLIDGLDRRKGRKLWHMQARAIKRARQRYHL